MALDSGRAVGIEITIYNPELDEDGSAGKLLTDLLVDALNVFATSQAAPVRIKVK
jgi:arginase